MQRFVAPQVKTPRVSSVFRQHLTGGEIFEIEEKGFSRPRGISEIPQLDEQFHKVVFPLELILGDPGCQVSPFPRRPAWSCARSPGSGP